MAIEVLRQDSRCAECGALLKKGTRAKVYLRKDGRVVVYGFHCHPPRREGAAPNGDRPQTEGKARALETDLEPLLDALADIRRALWTIVALIKKEAPVPAEAALPTQEEASPKAEEPKNEDPPALTAKDWAWFWAQCRKLGVDRSFVHELFEVESVKEIAKTRADLEAALQMIKECVHW